MNGEELKEALLDEMRSFYAALVTASAEIEDERIKRAFLVERFVWGRAFGGLARH